MAEKFEPSACQVDDTKILLLKEQKENNILKQTLSQKDETIENLKRCLQLYQTNLKENPFNAEAKHNVIECMKEIDDLKENNANHGNLTTDQFADIIIDDVDDLVNFVNTNKDLLGEEHFLKELDASYDVDSEIVKLEDNIDINDLTTFSGFSFGGLSQEYSNANDDIVSEIMSSPLDNFSMKCVGEDIKEMNIGNSVLLSSRLPECKTTTAHNSITGKSMKRLIPREFGMKDITEDEIVEMVDIFDSSSEMCGVPPLEVGTRQTPKRRIKRESDIRITDSAKKWLAANDFQTLFRAEQQPSSKRRIAGSESPTKDEQSEDKPVKENSKGTQSVPSVTGGKSLYKMFDCSKCGIGFSMDRKDVLNSFYKPGSPRCEDCQISPREKEKRTKANFMSRRKSETSQISEKMENVTKINTAKSNLFTPQSLHQTRNELTSNDTRSQCDICGKQFPKGGEWKYKRHMEVHNKGKQAVEVKKPMEFIKDKKYPVKSNRGKNFVKFRQENNSVELNMGVKQPVKLVVEGNQFVVDNMEMKKPVVNEGLAEEEDSRELNKSIKELKKFIEEEKNIKDQVEKNCQLKTNLETNACDVCQKNFKYKSTLIAHKKAHEGSFPFQCSLCSKFFKRIDDMVSHGVLDHKRRSVARLLDLLGRRNN